MFQALVMACLAYNIEYCKILEDQIGPYESRKQCQARAFEMSEAVHRHMPGYKAMKWRCRTLRQGELTAPIKKW